MSILGHFKNTFAFDYRSMALYRFLLGLIVMSDVLGRWGDITNFYTDVGLLPRSVFIAEFARPWSFSFHLANGSTLFMTGVFILHFILGLMMSLGFKTRISTLGAFLMTVSLHNRNWMINSGGYDVLRCLLFLSIFLPLGGSYSLDHFRGKTGELKKSFRSTWVYAFFLQVFLIYFVSYILKNHPIWREDYTAAFFSSRLDIFATSFGVWLRDFPVLLKGITIFSIYLEWLGPLLLVGAFLFGKFWWQVRVFLVLLFISFHFGIFLTMNIGLFTFICMVMWVIFLPAPFWDRPEMRLKGRFS